MMSIGRVCVKLAGRDAGKKAAIIDVIDNVTVLVDGEVRRRRCNIRHLEPTQQTIDIEKNASHDEVKGAFKKIGIEI